MKTNNFYLGYICKTEKCLGDECPNKDKHKNCNLIGGNTLELTDLELGLLLFMMRSSLRNEELLGVFAEDAAALYLKIKNI